MISANVILEENSGGGADDQSANLGVQREEGRVAERIGEKQRHLKEHVAAGRKRPRQSDAGSARPDRKHTQNQYSRFVLMGKAFRLICLKYETNAAESLTGKGKMWYTGSEAKKKGSVRSWITFRGLSHFCKGRRKNNCD